MTDWVASGQVKIDRGKEHIRKLEAEINDFNESRPYSVDRNEDLDTGDLFFVLRIRDAIPLRWGAIAGDAIHNLRASLDMLWRQAVGAKRSDRTTEFPFYKSAEKFERARCSRDIHGPRKAAVEALKVFRPYDGGDEVLCSLNISDNEDKHRALVPAYIQTEPLLFLNAAALNDPSLRPPGWGPPAPFLLQLIGEAVFVGDGTAIAHVPAAHRTKVEVPAKFVLTVAFGESEILKGKPIIPTLNEFAGKVDSVVQAFSSAGLIT